MSGLPADFDSFPDLPRPQHPNCRCTNVPRAYTPVWCWQLVYRGLVIRTGTLLTCRRSKQLQERWCAVNGWPARHMTIEPVTEEAAFGG
jgi:hypothetical protein